MSDKRHDPSGRNEPAGATGATGPDDPAAYMHTVEELERRSSTAARLFDVRRIIGGLFVVYGVIVTIAGITASEADLRKAQDININLWTGLGMLALGIFFLVWLRVSPAIPPPAEDEAGNEPGNEAEQEPPGK